MELTKRFADFINMVNYDNLPEEVITLAKERVLDTVGAALAGYGNWVFSDNLIDACRQLGSGDCHIIGNSGMTFPAARAAMLNVTFAHAIELDDGHINAGVHAGAVVVPTALTLGAKLRRSGKDVLTAIVIGYETIYRLAVGESPALIYKGFHPTTSCGTIGAMAVTGKLLGLNENQLANGLGLAGLSAAGLMEATVSGQQSKCVMVGNAALNGITAAYFAKSGLEGTLTVFEGKNGIFNTMSEHVNPDEVTKDLGKVFTINDTYIKLYPTVRHAHPAIEAVLDLMSDKGFSCKDVEKVSVGTHNVAYQLAGTVFEPKDAGEAKFSIPYSVAVALIEQSVSVRNLKPEYFNNPMYTEYAKRVEVKVDDGVDRLYPQKRGAVVNILLKDGRYYSGECYDLKGSPKKPINKEGLVKKFKDNATGLLDVSTVELLIDKCNVLENEADISGFVNLLSW